MKTHTVGGRGKREGRRERGREEGGRKRGGRREGRRERGSLFSHPNPKEKEKRRAGLENPLQMSHAALHCGALVRVTEDKPLLPRSTQCDLCT